MVGAEKMSKSLGNFTSLHDLLEHGDARAYRLLVLRAHYRAPIEVSKDNVAQAVKTLENLDGFARRFASVRGTVDGIDKDAFVAAAEDAKRNCPVSQALAGVDITLDAALA